MKPGPSIVCATMIVAAAAVAEDTHRELGPHAHGHGTLNIAIENTRVSLELEVPGMDIVGFEHSAESAEQKAAVDKATKLLAEPLALFKLSPSAGCKVTEAHVVLEAEHEKAEDDHRVAADERAGGTQSKNGRTDAEQVGEERDGRTQGHSEFHVTYALDCAEPANLTSIDFEYFASFAGAQALSVNVVSATTQHTYEVTRDKPSLALDRIM
jgi:hypothetical protein